jgi:1-acyl-sn-glycerol-3-phosphate acyltransferase
MLRVAQAAGVTLIPCAITGTDDIIRKNELTTGRSDITIRFGHPIEPASVMDPAASEKQQTVQLQKAVHDAVAALLKGG